MFKLFQINEPKKKSELFILIIHSLKSTILAYNTIAAIQPNIINGILK